MTTLRKIIIGATILVLTALVGYIIGYQAHEKEIGEETETHVTIIERDSVVYNLIKIDSTIVDWHLKPIEHFNTITQHDTIYIAIPISSFHFTDPLADVWCRGYGVILDSLCVHQKETIIENTVTITKPTYCNMIGVDAGLTDASIIYIRSVGRLSFGISAGYTYDKHATARGIIGYNF